VLNRDRALPDSAQPPAEWFIRSVASPCSNTSVYVCSAVSEDDERRNANCENTFCKCRENKIIIHIAKKLIAVH